MNNHIGPVVATTDQLKAIDCQPCGYVHLDPLPTQDELDRLYADEYYQVDNVGWFEKERREQWYWQLVYVARLLQLKKLSKSDGVSVYDFGAGCGWFIKAVRDRAPECTILGLEPSKFAMEHARKLSVDYFIMNKQATVWPHFLLDFVHASLVLEHVLTPLELLQDFCTHLKPGGILCVIVPNEFNPLQRQLKNYTPVHAHHLNYFTPDTLKALAKKAGFEIVRNTSTFPIEWLALHGLNYIKYPRLGKVAHWLRMAIEWSGLTFAPERWERVRDGWAAQGVGRETELWLRKV